MSILSNQILNTTIQKMFTCAQEINLLKMTCYYDCSERKDLK